MKVVVYLGHPAHFHLYKNVIKNLKNDGHEVEVLIKKKLKLLKLKLKEARSQQPQLLLK